MQEIEISDVVNRDVINSAIFDVQKKLKDRGGCYSMTEEGGCDSVNYKRGNKTMSIVLDSLYTNPRLVISVNNCKASMEYVLEEGKAPHFSRTLPAPTIGKINKVSEAIDGMIRFYLQ